MQGYNYILYLILFLSTTLRLVVEDQRYILRATLSTDMVNTKH